MDRVMDAGNSAAVRRMLQDLRTATAKGDKAARTMIIARLANFGVGEPQVALLAAGRDGRWPF